MFVLGLRLGRYPRTEASAQTARSSDGYDERGAFDERRDNHQSQFKQGRRRERNGTY